MVAGAERISVAMAKQAFALRSVSFGFTDEEIRAHGQTACQNDGKGGCAGEVEFRGYRHLFPQSHRSFGCGDIDPAPGCEPKAYRDHSGSESRVRLEPLKGSGGAADWAGCRATRAGAGVQYPWGSGG